MMLAQSSMVDGPVFAQRDGPYILTEQPDHQDSIDLKATCAQVRCGEANGRLTVSLKGGSTWQMPSAANGYFCQGWNDISVAHEIRLKLEQWITRNISRDDYLGELAAFEYDRIEKMHMPTGSVPYAVHTGKLFFAAPLEEGKNGHDKPDMDIVGRIVKAVKAAYERAFSSGLNDSPDAADYAPHRHIIDRSRKIMYKKGSVYGASLPTAGLDKRNGFALEFYSLVANMIAEGWKRGVPTAETCKAIEEQSWYIRGSGKVKLMSILLLGRTRFHSPSKGIWEWKVVGTPNGPTWLLVPNVMHYDSMPGQRAVQAVNAAFNILWFPAQRSFLNACRHMLGLHVGNAIVTDAEIRGFSKSHGPVKTMCADESEYDNHIRNHVRWAVYEIMRTLYKTSSYDDPSVLTTNEMDVYTGGYSVDQGCIARFISGDDLKSGDSRTTMIGVIAAMYKQLWIDKQIRGSIDGLVYSFERDPSQGAEGVDALWYDKGDDQMLITPEKATPDEYENNWHEVNSWLGFESKVEKGAVFLQTFYPSALNALERPMPNLSRRLMGFFYSERPPTTLIGACLSAAGRWTGTRHHPAFKDVQVMTEKFVCRRLGFDSFTDVDNWITSQSGKESIMHWASQGSADQGWKNLLASRLAGMGLVDPSSDVGGALDSVVNLLLEVYPEFGEPYDVQSNVNEATNGGTVQMHHVAAAYQKATI